MKEKIKKHAKIIGIILLYLIGASILQLLFKSIIPIKISNFLIPIIFIILLFLFFKDDIKNDIIDLKTNWKTFLKKYIKYYIIAYLISSFFNVIAFFIVKDTTTNNALIIEQFKNYPIYSLLDTILFAPFIEEVIFRLNIKKGYNKKLTFVLVSGCIFGLLHLLVSTSLLELLYAIPYCILGCMLSLVYYDSKNIFASVMIHSLNNILATLVIIGALL